MNVDLELAGLVDGRVEKSEQTLVVKFQVSVYIINYHARSHKPGA